MVVDVVALNCGQVWRGGACVIGWRCFRCGAITRLSPTPSCPPPRPTSPIRRNAIIETTFADLIDGPLAHIPSGLFAANCAWLGCAVIAHNLLRAAGALAGWVMLRGRCDGLGLGCLGGVCVRFVGGGC